MQANGRGSPFSLNVERERDLAVVPHIFFFLDLFGILGLMFGCGGGDIVDDEEVLREMLSNCRLMLSNTWNTEDEGQADEDGGLMIVTLFPAGIPVALLVPMNLSGVNLDSAENLKRLSFRSTRVFPLFFSLHVSE
ncbi:hypothetical protein HID58_082754 [Brassica napus]|uniref:Uncharacterized protein n=1 Tax=Brassica napus TaxID=3708 RepID=A0ABQ7YE20_BRANA|nr:hypothetical protein HID58_082754 [Brassica napus]